MAKELQTGWLTKYIEELSHRLGTKPMHLRNLMDSGILEHLLHPRADFSGLHLEDLHHSLGIPGVINVDFTADINDYLAECRIDIIDPLIDEIDESQFQSRYKGLKTFEVEVGSTFTKQLTVEEVHKRMDNVDEKWKLFKFRHLIEYGHRFPHLFSFRTIVAAGQIFKVGDRSFIFCLFNNRGGQSEIKAMPIDTPWPRNTTFFPRYKMMP